MWVMYQLDSVLWCMGQRLENGGRACAGGSARVRRFYPFSQGQRGCVGRGLAVMNYTAAAAVLLGTFHFRLADEVLISSSSSSCCPIQQSFNGQAVTSWLAH